MRKRLLTVLAVSLMTLGAGAPAFASGPQTGIDAFCDKAPDSVTEYDHGYCLDGS